MRNFRSDGMVKLEIEIENEHDEFRVEHTSYYNIFSEAKNRIPILKKKYALHNKNYQIFITIIRR